MIAATVLLVALFLSRGVGALGVKALSSWRAATRLGLAAMFFFTATAHFTPMREGLIAMVPTWVPYPVFIVFATGIFEVLAAVALLLPRYRRAAGILLILFLIAVFPANIRAAGLEAIPGGLPSTPLLLRAPIQLLFLALTWWSTQTEAGPTSRLALSRRGDGPARGRKRGTARKAVARPHLKH